MAVESVVFDVDGVLVKAFVFAQILEQQYGVTREHAAPFFQGPFKQCVVGNADLKESIQPFLIEWGWRGSVDECLQTWFSADSEVNMPALDAATVLRQAGYSCFVASTQERHRAFYLQDTVGLTGRFDGFFFSCDVGLSKPDRRFFDYVAQTIGIQASEILLIDDSTTNVEGARTAGWNAERYMIGDDIYELLARHGLPTHRASH